MIPRIIHYCWFGNLPKPKYFQNCLESWIKYFPSFQIVEWNESNVDFSHSFVIEAVKQEKWAFVSDFVRLQKLVEFGGIYLDTDMLFIKPFNLDLLDYKYFLGMENSSYLSAGVLGSDSNSVFFSKVFEFYLNLDSYDFENLLIPSILNKVYLDFVGLQPCPQIINGGLILPYYVFYPLPFKLKEFHWNKFIVNDSLAVHLWAGSWMDISDNNFKDLIIKKFKYHISKYYIPNDFLKYAKSI